MPLYDYECPSCGVVVEVQHSISGPTMADEMPNGVVVAVTTDSEDREVDRFLLHILCKGSFMEIADAKMVKLISAPHLKTIVKGNSDFRERERDRLEKRSKDHWKRVGRKEAIARSEKMGVDASHLKRAELRHKRGI